MPVEVTPRGTVDFWLALNQKIHSWNIEVGYDLWWRQKEKVELPCCPTPLDANTLGIADIACPTSGTTASTATISQSVYQVTSDPSFVALTDSNLNLNSAAHPNVITNKVYLASSYSLERPHCRYTFGLGGSYEVACNPNALNQWAAWGVVGFSF
jgi:hypothetical protein